MDPLTVGTIIVSVLATGTMTALSRFVRKRKFRHSQQVDAKLPDGRKVTIQLPIDSDSDRLKSAIESTLKEE